MSDMFNVLFSLAKDGGSSAVPVASPGSSSRDNLIATVYKQLKTRAKILEPYRRLKNALKNLQDEYLQSKDNNVFMRYSRMQHMIHEVILLEKQYWQLVDIPAQEISESPNAYVFKVMSLLEERSSQPPPKTGGIASLLGATMLNVADKTKDQNLYEQIRNKSTDDLRRECDRLYTELFKLIRKYLGLRRVVQELTSSFQDSRFYPIVPRYPLLKTMIKRVLRAPAFSEICHEASE
uniref:GED domain-containing protein n=1 Tax=Panagrellus redivivus TaxID=6233 RepID=A0A7E4UZB7_PANRE